VRENFRLHNIDQGSAQTQETQAQKPVDQYRLKSQLNSLIETAQMAAYQAIRLPLRAFILDDVFTSVLESLQQHYAQSRPLSQA